MASKNPNAAEAVNPFGDLSKMLEQVKLPGVDMAEFADARRKDIEALVKANEAAQEGMQALARKQTEMLTQAVQALQGGARGMGIGDPAKQAELARGAWQKTLADMTDLADMARKAQTDAMASITQRATQNMADMQKMMQMPAGPKK
jgi:phasin family protein